MRSEKEEPELSGGRLDDRVLATLQGLSGQIAFSGLRRALRAHPESLSRTLRRLEREGLVERVGGAYRALGPSPSLATAAEGGLRTVARVELPPGLLPSAVLARLTGRWFGSLRWVGIIERSGERWLAWGPRDGGGIVLLGLRAGALRVCLPEGLGVASDPNEDEDAAYELLYHAVEALRSPSGVGSDAGDSLRAFAARSPTAPTDN
jgi:DNA-binding Lrp family transcriptional regulator